MAASLSEAPVEGPEGVCKRKGPFGPHHPKCREKGLRNLPSGERSHLTSQPWAPIAGQQRRPVAECPHCTRWPDLGARHWRGLLSPEQNPGVSGSGKCGGRKGGEAGAVPSSSLFPSWTTTPQTPVLPGSPAPIAGREPLLTPPPNPETSLRPQCQAQARCARLCHGIAPASLTTALGYIGCSPIFRGPEGWD